MDFDDLISLPVRLFDEAPGSARALAEQAALLLVDEYQDTNRAQYRLLKLLSGVRGAFTAVATTTGDLRLAGADVENLKLLQQDYPKLKVISSNRTTAPRAASSGRQHRHRQQREALRQSACGPSTPGRTDRRHQLP